jgi:hypothetical protein
MLWLTDCICKIMRSIYTWQAVVAGYLFRSSRDFQRIDTRTVIICIFANCIKSCLLGHFRCKENRIYLGHKEGCRFDSLPYLLRDLVRPATPPKSSAPRTILYLCEPPLSYCVATTWVNCNNTHTVHQASPASSRPESTPRYAPANYVLRPVYTQRSSSHLST